MRHQAPRTLVRSAYYSNSVLRMRRRLLSLLLAPDLCNWQEANCPGMSDEIGKPLDAVFLQGGDVDATVQKLAEIVKTRQSA